MEPYFTHAVLWANPMALLTFFALAMSFISLWIRKTAWLWGSFLCIAIILAFQAQIIVPVALIPIFLLFLCHFFMKNEIKAWGRLFIFTLTSVLSLGLAFHLFPGFSNWNIACNLPLSPDAMPYSLWMNFDKPFIGIFPLALSIPLIQSKKQLKAIFKMALPMTLLGVAILMFISLKIGTVKWDPKIPTIIFVWLICNLIFVSVPEEAFFRGFFQREIGKWLGKGFWASVGAVLATSLFFTLLHVQWVPSIPFLCLVFTASVIYGTVYEVTQSIEASIFCHFALNSIHFLFFTYPALRSCV